MTEPGRIGLIINPIAGMGGALAAHGSDLLRSLADAYERGGKPVAQQRAKRALKRLSGDTRIIAAAGIMGEDAARECGFIPDVIGGSGRQPTANDTKMAARTMLERGADLLLFAGGDGTARDILEAVGERLPLIGIPTGVKMNSSVFALSPEAAGDSAANAAREGFGLRRAEIMDVDEAELAAGRPSARLFGYAAIPALPRYFQPAKSSRPSDGEAAIEALGRSLARNTPRDRLVLIGPGTTMTAVKPAFGSTGTLLGVDAFVNGACIAGDADAATLEALCAAHPDAILLIGVVGNQGFVFGRGNQQISPSVLRAVDAFRIVATREKLLALPAGKLRVDTGDIALDLSLEGYHRVLTAPDEVMMMRLTAEP